jgi:hypothetical protein
VFPGDYNYLFITSGAGWSAVNEQNIVWQNETCSECKYDFNHGLVVASGLLTTIPPFGPEVAVAEYTSGTFNVSVDASKERDGSQVTVVNYGGQPITFNPDSNMSISSPLTLAVGNSVSFRFSGAIGKFVLMP